MRIITQHEYGGPEVLAVEDAPEPRPLATEVLVRVAAIGLNPLEARLHDGEVPLLGRPPFVLGWDVSGVVVDAQTGRLRPGDEVFGMPLFPRVAGGYAEVIAAPALHLVRRPPSLSHVEAAALPVVGLTAWQGLVDLAGVGEGDRVLVHAGGGGVGHVAIQIAKALGAYVITTASPGKRAFVDGLGADEVIDYTTVDFTDAVRDVDVVLDTVGGDTAERSLDVLRPGGHLVTAVADHDTALNARYEAAGMRFSGIAVDPDPVGLRARRPRRTGRAARARPGDLPVRADRRRAPAPEERARPGQARAHRVSTAPRRGRRRRWSRTGSRSERHRSRTCGTGCDGPAGPGGDRAGLVAGCSAGLRTGAVSQLGTGLRLSVRSAAQRVSAVPGPLWTGSASTSYTSGRRSRTRSRW